MLTAAPPLKTARTYLAEHLCANDYYCKDETVTGTWVGRGAEFLGLHGQSIGPSDAAFEALRTNRHPATGLKLTERSREIAFHDFQISAPKSVSIQAITAGDRRLIQAHEESWRVAFNELERYAARRDHQGEKANSEDVRFTGNLVTAAFTHDASRALDAQIHTHLVCVNATRDVDTGQWYALQNSEMFKAAEMVGRLYEHELARRVLALGYDIRLVTENGKTKGWELAHITDAECAVQSTRRRDIEAKIAEYVKAHGFEPSTAVKHAMAVETRQRKLAERSTPEVIAAQRSKHDPESLMRFEKARHDAMVRDAPPRNQATEITWQALESAARHFSHTRAVFEEKDLLSRALRENPGKIDFSVARMALTDGLGSKLVRLSDPMRAANAPEKGVLTTLDNLAAEFRATEIVREQLGRHNPLAAAYAPRGSLSADQRAAVQGILACRDGVACLRGPAGTGKTTTLTEIENVIRTVAEAAELRTVYVAPTHAAKAVLRADGFKEATTVAQLLANLKAGKENLDRTLLVIDEAGMQSTRDGLDLLQSAIQSGGRVLYAGDQKQLSAVAAGDFLHILQQHSPMKTFELTSIHRQRDPGYRSAMELMARGKVKDSLALLDAQGRIKEGKSAYLANAAKDYCERSQDVGEDWGGIALIASTWREVDQLNALVRDELKTKGLLTGSVVLRETVDKLTLSPEEQRSIRNYEPGMLVSSIRRTAGLEPGEWYPIAAIKNGRALLENGRSIRPMDVGDRLQLGRRTKIELQAGDKILLQGNDKRAGLTNGMTGIVTTLNDREIRFRPFEKGVLSDKEKMIPANYQTLSHGFAMTVHASQGQTLQHVVGAASKSLSGQLWNVMTSRGRRDLSIHVADKQRIMGATENAIRNRPAALDYVSEKTPGIGLIRPRASEARALTPLPTDRASRGVRPLPEPQRTRSQVVYHRMGRAARIRIERMAGRHFLGLATVRAGMQTLAARSAILSSLTPPSAPITAWWTRKERTADLERGAREKDMPVQGMP